MGTTTTIKFSTVNEYIAAFPKNVRLKLQELRKTIRAAAPQAEELISYDMPTYKQEGILVGFAAWKSHIGFYPRMEAFKKELSGYEGAKGSVKFPMDQPIPLGLISKMVKYRVKQNLEKSKLKKVK